MSTLLVVEPWPLTVTSSRGSGGTNLAGSEPKEVWVDSAVGSAAVLTMDLGRVRTVDTIFLGFIRQSVAGSTWSITGGVNAATEQVLQASNALRVPDATNQFADISHALSRGTAVSVRFIAVSIVQPAGQPVLSAAILIAGNSFCPDLGQEWGAGRRPIDTSSITALQSGGFSIVEGARKKAFSWTLGDLTTDEVDRLDAIADRVGDSRPVVVVEDYTRSAGLRARIHYGLFKWKAFERRNRNQTRWEMEVEQWV